MSNKSLSKIDMRSAVLALSVVAMLVAVSFGVNNAEAASPVTVASDISSAYVMEGEFVTATITVTNTESGSSAFRKMEVNLNAVWIAGGGWTLMWQNTDGDLIDDDTISLSKESSKTVKLLIFCDGACEAGDTGTISVFGLSDPRWYDGGTDSGTTDDCQPSCSDTTPASSSSNTTNTVSLSITAKTGSAHTLDCDQNSDAGNNEMFQSTSYQWGYDLENTGWNDDTYTFATTVNTAGGGSVDDWTITAGLSNKALTGTSDSTSTAVHKAEASMTIKPAATARPGVYTIGLLATSTASGNEKSCTFNVVIPEPDLEILSTDISFSHSSAWINSRGDSQRVTIYSKVRNNGGTVDSEGVTVTDVDVIFLVDGSQLGSVQSISSLAYGEEVTLQAYWNPGRANDGDEVGIPIKVSVDPSVSIQETEADNNIGSQYFKVVKTKASNPSFYMSFLSLIGAVGAAVLMSTYYRNKDSEE